MTRSARELAQMGGLPDDESLNAGDNVPYDQAGNRTSWRFALDHHRSVTAGAHQGGLNEVSTELGAVFGYAYQMNLGDYKGILDKEWAAGTTRATVHGYTYQSDTATWPGDSTFFDYVSDSWNSETFPQWGDWRPLNDYWARGTSVLEAGTARADVALYRDGFITTAAQGLGNQPVMRPLFDSENLERAGYAVEFLDPQGVLDPEADGTGVLYPRGPRYKAIVVDERALPAAVAEQLAVEAEQGLAVVLVGDLPSADTSYKNATRGDTRVRQAITRLLDAPKVARVGTQAEAAGALERLGVAPDAKWSAPAQLLTQHRETKTTDYFYLYNATNDPIDVNGSFASSGRPYALEPVDRRDRPGRGLRARAAAARPMPLQVPALGTTVIAFRKGEAAPALHAVSTTGGERGRSRTRTPVELRDTSAGARTVTVADGTTRAATIPALPGAISPASWRLHVEPESASAAAPLDLQLDALKDWRELPGHGESGRRRHLHGDARSCRPTGPPQTAAPSSTSAPSPARCGSRSTAGGGARLGRRPPLGRLAAAEAGRQRADGARSRRRCATPCRGSRCRTARCASGLFGPVALVPFGARGRRPARARAAAAGRETAGRAAEAAGEKTVEEGDGQGGEDDPPRRPDEEGPAGARHRPAAGEAGADAVGEAAESEAGDGAGARLAQHRQGARRSACG